jgi:hypothetical protein
VRYKQVRIALPIRIPPANGRNFLEGKNFIKLMIVIVAIQIPTPFSRAPR